MDTIDDIIQDQEQAEDEEYARQAEIDALLEREK